MRRTILVLPILLALAGCSGSSSDSSQTFTPPSSGSPALAFHPVVDKDTPGARPFWAVYGVLFSHKDDYYQPDQKLDDIHLTSLFRHPGVREVGQVWVSAKFGLEDTHRLERFAKKHPAAKGFAVRFASDTVGVIVTTVRLTDLVVVKDEGRIDQFLIVSKEEEADKECRKLMGIESAK
jgi:hypothetical protein